MPSILIKGIPPGLYCMLKAEARRNRRSMNREALAIIEEALSMRRAASWPQPVRGRFPLTASFIREAVRKGRS